MGTALIVLSWTWFLTLGLPLWGSIVLTVVGAFIALFALLFLVYFFNIDMKALALLQKALQSHYDRLEKKRKKSI